MSAVSSRSRCAVRPVVAALAVCGALGLSGCASIAGIQATPTSVSTDQGSVSIARAQAIAAQVIGQATKAATSPGAEGDAARKAAFAGDALTAAQADAKLASTRSAADKAALVLTPTAPVVLAISQGPAYPRSMVVKTTRAASGLPVLYLMTTPDVKTAFRIVASAQMLPGAQVPAFDPLATGSPSLGDGSDLATAPEKLTASYAASLAFPAPAADPKAPFTKDSFATTVHTNAGAASLKLGTVASLSQEHTAKDVPGGLRLAAQKGALAFTVLQRKDEILRKTEGTITPTPQFTALTGLTEIKAEATQSWLEFVVFVIPQTAGAQATAVAADEHLVAATGT